MKHSISLISRSAQKTLSVLLCLLLVWGCSPLRLLPAFTPAFADETEEVIPIRSAEDFLRFALACSSDVYSSGKHFSLEADISLSGTDFLPVPWFGGIFEGNGHSVSGLLFDSAGSRQGLFRTVASGAEIRNLKVSGTVSAVGSACIIGGIAGVNRGTLTGCSFEGSVSGIQDVGGVVGHNDASGKVTDCRFSGTVIGEHQVGGIVGRNDGSVTQCVSEGGVNPVAVTPSDREIDFLKGGFDISQLSEDEFLSLSNIGGIAGLNTGILDACVSEGPVGYPSTGYNVGGIAGKTTGFIRGCENRGEVSGRRDVGGIAGQLIPFSDLDLSSGKLDGLSWQLEMLNMLLGGLVSNFNTRAGDLSDSVTRLQVYTSDLLEAIEALVRIPNENVQRILDSIGIDPTTGEIYFLYPELANVDLSMISISLMNLYGESLYFADLAKQSASGLASDLQLVALQISNVLNELFNTVSKVGDGPETSDLSVEEAYTRNTGAIAECSNTGGISAENNSGGILGNCSFEVEFDMEDRLNVSEYLTANVKHNLFAAVRDCRSVSAVHAQKGCAGGIAGNMDLGIAVGCVFAGSAEVRDGDQVGGITGSTKGTVQNCWSRVLLSGSSYVGGIAGLGTDIRDCRAWAHFDRWDEYGGAVAGWTEGVLSGNLYTAVRPAGVDGVSISGETDEVSEAEFLKLEGLPGQFDSILVQYVVEGEVIAEESVPFGGSLNSIPEVANRDGMYWTWDLPEDGHIFTACRIEGQYRAPKSTIATSETPPLFLVEGQFYHGQELRVVPAGAPEVPGELILSRTVSVSGWDGELTVRMLTDQDGTLWLFGKGTAPVETSYTRDGSYIVFRMPNGGSVCYTAEASPKVPDLPFSLPFSLPLSPPVLAACAAVPLLIVILSVSAASRRRKRKAAAAAAASQETQDPDESEESEEAEEAEKPQAPEAPKGTPEAPEKPETLEKPNRPEETS